MGLSPQQIITLRGLLKNQLGLTYTDVEAQRAGLTILRFIVAKQRRSYQLTANKKGMSNNEIK